MKLFEKLKNSSNLPKKKSKFISSFIGTLIYGIGGITSMGIGHYSVYITSYFHHKQVNIDMHYGNLIMPILSLSHSLFSPLAGYIENKIGIYFALILSFLLTELDLILFINQTSIWLSFLLIIFLGFSNGIGMAIPGKNLYLYYPEKGGIIGSLMGSCFIIIGMTLSVIGEKIINPGKYTLDKGERFYPLEISKNYKKYYNYILVINPFALILALFLIKKYNPEYEEESIQDNFSKINKNKLLKNDENYSKNIKSALMNKRIWRLAGISILTPFVISFSRNTFRVYGALASISGAVMQYSQLFTGFSNVFVGPIWGYINDKYKYEKIIKIICSCCILQAIFFTLFIKYNVIYLICILFGSIIGSGFMSASHLHILKVYGIKYSLEIGGVIGIFGGIFNILNSSLSLLISKFCHTGEELQFAYRFIYLAGIVISGVGFYLTLNEKDDKFIYKFAQNENDYLTMINSDFKEKDKNENIINIPKEIELVIESNSSETTLDDTT